MYQIIKRSQIVKRAKVSVLKTNPQTVIEDYVKLIELADADQHLDINKPTILKDNISWHFFYPAANTTPWQLEGTIAYLNKHNYPNVTCVQNETVVINAFKGERNNKYPPILKKNEIPILYNFKKEDMKWIEYKPKGETLVLHKIFPEGIFIPDYFFDRNIIHLPTLKCHVYTTITGAMKNAFGGLLNRKRHYTHTYIHETLVDLLMIQKEIHSGIFAVTDGTVAGNGPGPRTMEYQVKDYILASGDSVAIDAVAAKMMGFDPMSLDFIRLAHEKGLGVGDIQEIEIVGEDLTDVNFNFKVGDNAASSFVRQFWFGPLKMDWLQKILFHTPMVYFFILGSYLFHDYLWFPVKGTKVVKDYLESTQWGKLWNQYPYE